MTSGPWGRRDDSRWTAASQSARGGLFVIALIGRTHRHCADWADAPGLPPLCGLRPPLRWGGEGERPGTAVKGGGEGERPGTFAACGEVPEMAGLLADSGEGGREC